MDESLSHIDTQVCRACLKEKNLQEFSTYRRNGEKRYRHVCRVCKNKREKLRTSKFKAPIPLFSDEDMPKKRCNNCFEWKNDSDFNLGKVACKSCEEKRERERKLFAIEMTRLRQRNASIRYHERHPGARKANKLQYIYGLSYEEYIQMFVLQDNKCAICGIQPPEGKILYVDHNHQTKDIRGLLCQKCNTLIGMANDNVDVLENAIKYLHKYS